MKILRSLENDLEKIDVSTLDPNASATPQQILEILSSLKGVLITVLSFIKFFTTEAADVKIDALISWLGQIPVQPKP